MFEDNEMIGRSNDSGQKLITSKISKNYYNLAKSQKSKNYQILARPKKLKYYLKLSKSKKTNLYKFKIFVNLTVITNNNATGYIIIKARLAFTQ